MSDDQNLSEPIKPENGEASGPSINWLKFKEWKWDYKKFLKLAWPWAALILVVGAAYFFYGQNGALTLEEAKIKASEFINKNLVPEGATATISQVIEESGLYKIDLELDGQAYTSYMSRDGRKFFIEGLDVPVDASSVAMEGGISKSSKPSIKLFVMSYCPYSLQIEKGIIPALNLLGSKIDFRLGFVSYAMHGEAEIDENLTQYCIQEGNPDKLIGYLDCFAKSGDGQACLNGQAINQGRLASCVSAINKQFKVKEGLADQKTWLGGVYPLFNVNQEETEKYSVTGSPALVINENLIKNAPRDPAGLLKIICSAFNEAPEACDQELSSEPFSAGFGEEKGEDSQASCGG